MSDTPFQPGEKVLLIDQRDRTYLVTLQAGATYHTHSGTLAHDDLLGKSEGITVGTSKGMVLVAFRPRFADFVMKMPRGAQVVYPKDLGPIVTSADVFPGARVVEAGTGSGALTIALCRAAFFLTWCVVPIFVFPSGEVAVGMTMFALYGAMIEALVIASAAAVAAYGD